MCIYNISKIFFQIVKVSNMSLRKKCPYAELFWSVLSRILTEYGEIRSIQHLVQNNTFHAVYIMCYCNMWCVTNLEVVKQNLKD